MFGLVQTCKVKILYEAKHKKNPVFNPSTKNFQLLDFKCGTINFKNPEFYYIMMNESAIFKGSLVFQTNEEPYEVKLSSDQIKRKEKINLIEERKIYK